ncbi:related to integral membrane protein [Phialocephala subalpina]|uniref:Related to integral membrane protein n=1 Tax=Phialocephala subalpina TaxID=576137 RepID=A0A1L7XEY2_9HELO|nr:related to integral membrane protein [Phialocephala subalpina]
MSTTLLDAKVADVNRGPAILGATITVTILAFASVCARMYVRVRMIRSTGPDDYVILFAMLLSLIGIGFVIPEVQNGAGRHVALVEPAKAKLGLELNFITQPIYLWAITIVKCSIALFLLRIAPTKFFKRLLWGTIIFLLVYTFAAFMTIVLQCKNLAINWDTTVQTTCWAPTTLRNLSYVNSSINIFTDLMMAALPIPMLWNLQINGRVKASLCCIMGLGIFACVSSIMKLSTLPSYGLTGDFLFDSTMITIWTIVECNVGIITACLPCLKPLFKRMLENPWAYGSSKTKKNTNDNNLQSRPHGSKYAHTASVSRDLSSKNNFEMLGSRKGDDLENNRSEESILPLQGNTITKTTFITVDREVGLNSHKLDRGREQRGFWVMGKREYAPERRIEDRV